MGVLETIQAPAVWRAQVADAQAAWARNQAGAEEQAAQLAAAKAAKLAEPDPVGEARLRDTLAPWGAPVDSLLPFWRNVSKDSGITLSELADGAQSYFSNITNPAGNSPWWGANAWARVPLQGAGLSRPGFDWARYLDPAAEAQQQKALGVQLMQQQQQSGGGGFLDDLLPIAAIAGIVTGGLGLVAALGETAATTAAGWVSAEAGAGYAAGLAADSVAASSAFSLSGAASLAKNAYSVASGLNTLTADKPQPSTSGATRMPATAPSSPLDIFYTGSGTQAAAETKQGTMPTVPGAAGGPPPNASMLAGLPPGVVLVGIGLVLWWAFHEKADKGGDK